MKSSRECLDQQFLRGIELMKFHVQNLELDLNGLTVVTECASKAYAFTTIAAALAGARVFAVGKTTRYGTFDEVKGTARRLQDYLGIPGEQITYFENQVSERDLAEVDILLNSGAVRPIDEKIVQSLKPTAVIPLMWETWEFRSSEVDLKACQKRQIPVIGTNERFPKAYMFDYPGFLAMKLLFSLGVEIANNRILILGEGLTAEYTHKTFRDSGVSCDWMTNTKVHSKALDVFDYERANEYIRDAKRLDAIVIADHRHNHVLLGNEGILELSKLEEKFPFVKIAHICGRVAIEDLYSSSLEYGPKEILPVGYMSYETVSLGWEPAILLNTAGLKVGELAARSRLKGESAEQAIQAAEDHGIGMDFEGGFANFKV